MNQMKIDKLFLRLAKDTLQLYHAATGKGKFDLARKIGLISMVLESGCFVIMSISLAIVGLYFISFLFLIGGIVTYFNFKNIKSECKYIEALEKQAKESGLMVPPSAYSLSQTQGRLGAIMGLIFMTIPPYDVSTALFFGIFLRGLSYYVIMIENQPGGKNIFEKVKNKIKSINLVPATLKPVKVNGR